MRQACLPPRACLTPYAPLVSEYAREGVMAMLEGKQRGLSYDEVRDEAPNLIDEVEAWMALVDQSAPRPV